MYFFLFFLPRLLIWFEKYLNQLKHRAGCARYIVKADGHMIVSVKPTTEEASHSNTTEMHREKLKHGAGL